MTRPLCSVVLATYQRAHLLARSLSCYARQEFPKEEFEIVVVDDHGNDGTRETVLEWSLATRIRAVVLTVSPKPAEWVDCGWVLNAGIRASSGRHVLLTHPEVMPGRTSVKDCVDKLDHFERSYDIGCDEVRHRHPFGLYACCRCYYLSPREQVLIDSCPWEAEGPIAVRTIDGFYELDSNGHPDYCHKATDSVAQPGSRLPKWESFIFGGHSRETWKRLGGMLETQRWGSVDIAWMHRRRTLGIPNFTCPAESAICTHQNHDLPGEVITNRSMEAWVQELKSVDLETPSKLIYPAVDNLG